MKTKYEIKNKFNLKNKCTLFLGDGLELLKTIPNESVQLVITSPPYNIGKPYEKKKNLDEYLNFQEKFINESYKTIKPSGSMCWQVGNYVENGHIIPLDVLLYPIFDRLGMKLRNRIVWHFGHGLHCSKRFSGRYETILWFTKSKSDEYLFNLNDVRVPQKYPGKTHSKGEKMGQYSSNPNGKNPADVWENEKMSDFWNIPNVKANHVEKTNHPCQFPVALVSRLIIALSNTNDLIIDPFMGVGSTAIAALDHKRRFAGADIYSKYVRVAYKRVNKLKARKLMIREDIPIYIPDITNKLTRNPFMGMKYTERKS